jgi:hypothetical protein
MSITILEPLSGDTVSTTVSIKSAYYNLSSDDVLCKIASRPDTEVNLNGTDTHTGSVPNVPVGSQTVEVLVNDTLEATEEGVIVTDGPLPVPIEEVIGEDINVKEKKRRYKVQGGKVPDGSVAAYVVCQAIEIDVATGKHTVVKAGAASLDATKKWKVVLEFEVKGDDRFQYVVRAFAYDKTQRLLGSTTRGAEKAEKAKKAGK